MVAYHVYYLSLSAFTRIDSHLVIKITDFGLSEDVFVRNYFRQGTSEEIVKLPVKWMAPESLSDGHFSEKSDVVSYQTSLIENTSEQSVSKSTLNYLYRFPTWFRWYFPNWNYISFMPCVPYYCDYCYILYSYMSTTLSMADIWRCCSL